MPTTSASIIAGCLFAGAAGLVAVPAMAAPAAAPSEAVGLIQDLCLDTGSVWDQAQTRLQARVQAPETIAEDKMGKASIYSLKVSGSARVELMVSHDDNAVMSCTVHATLGDVKSTFSDMQKRYGMKGALADYMSGKPAKDVPFVARSGAKPGRKMLGLIEFQHADGQTAAPSGGSVQAIILRDEAAAGPPPVKTSAAKPGSAKPAAAKVAAVKAHPITTGSIASAKK